MPSSMSPLPKQRPPPKQAGRKKVRRYSSGSLTTAGSSCRSSSSSSSSSSVIIVVVRLSRRRHVADEPPADQPRGKVLGDAQNHVGSCLMSRRSQADSDFVSGSLVKINATVRARFPARRSCLADRITGTNLDPPICALSNVGGPPLCSDSYPEMGGVYLAARLRRMSRPLSTLQRNNNDVI
jgi:hypothetical protein